MNFNKHPEMIDFCNGELGTTIECDGAFNDHHPPSNLISNSTQLKTKGFLAEYYMKPPVKLVLQFNHPIHLCKIIFHPQVGEQVSQIFEVWASTGSSECQKIGRSGGNDINFFCFKNFYCRQHDEPRAKSVFRLGPENSLQSVKQIHLKILKSIKSGIPCLRSLEVWGYPAKSVSEEATNILRTKWKAMNEPPKTNIPVGLSESVQTDLEVCPPPSVDDDIPVEFLDALTHNCMDVPMVLPCGQIVDRKTLDTYNSQEEKWGRLPNDPFTGKIFTSSSRPVFEALLKSRIDAFFIQRQGISINILKRNNCLSGFSSSTPSTSSNPPNPFLQSHGGEEAVAYKVLEGRKLFILHNNSHQSSINSCSKCMSKETLYKLICSHIICKSCMNSEVKLNELTCPQCQQICAKKDVFRYHTMQ